MLFLIKNAAYFDKYQFSNAVLPSSKSGKARRTYLHELSKINQHLDFPAPSDSITYPTEKNIQLSLFVPEKQVRDELNEFKSLYNEFHILTYKLDEAFQIAEIMHYLPNSADNIAYEIDDLSKYISGAELTDEEREVVAPEQVGDMIDPAAFDLGVFEDEEERK